MAKKIPIEKIHKRKVRRLKVRKSQNVVDVRPLEPEKISFDAINEKSIRKVSDVEFLSLHLRCHQLFEGIRGRLLGIKVKGFVAKAIQERRVSCLVSTGKVESELPVYIIAEGKVYGLAEISKPKSVNTKQIRSIMEGLIDAHGVEGYSGRENLFAYQIKTLESFDKPRVYKEPRDEENLPVVMGVNLIGVNLKLTLSDLINVHKIIVGEMKRRGIEHNIIGEIDTKTALLMRIRKMKSLPDEKDNDDLVGLHGQIHLRFNKNGDTEHLQVVHAYVVEEMSARGLPHITDDADILDLVNKGFRNGLMKRKSDYSLSRVHSIKPEKRISLEEILSSFDSFKLREPYIYLIGDLVANGETEKSIDILIKDSESMTEKMKKVIEWKVLKAISVELQDRVIFHYDDYEGSMTPFVELFNLTATRIPGNEIVSKSKVVRIDRQLGSKKSKSKKQATGKRIIKQKDPFMQIPDENEKHKFVAQTHFIGKGVHSDLRFEYTNPRLLIGWTLNTQIAKSIKEPVTTLKEAKSLKPGRYSKINWKNGDWLKRRSSSGDVVNVTLRAKQKSPSPKEWLNIEGIIEPGAPGASENYPGVFVKVDKGFVEYGAQKSFSHEYFFNGKVLNSRIVFRQLRIPQVSVNKFLEFVNGDMEIQKVFLENLFESDIEDKVFLELEKRAHSLSVELKEIMSAENDERSKAGDVGWICIKPENQLPYVLSNRAVRKKWVPPVNISALPKNIRLKIPKEFHYWVKKSEADRINVRNELVAALKKEDVKLPVEIDKLSELDARFALQNQTFENDDDGDKEILVDEIYDIRIDVGAEKLLRIRLSENPIDDEEMTAIVSPENDKKRISFEGEIEPGSSMNPSKKYSSEISIIDSGKCLITEKREGYLEIIFVGEKLKGTWVVEQNDDKEIDNWLFKKTEPAIDESTEKVEVEIAKINKKLRLVTGIVLKPDYRDAHDDIYSEEIIRAAAHNFVANYNETTAIGFMHADFNRKLLLVESYIAPFDFQLDGRDVPKGAWVITVKVLDDEIWREILNKKIRGFSIGGLATAIPG